MSSIPKVSAVIPVYNTAQYLDDCLSSMANQSLKEIELIVVVDETSEDNSVDICNHYAEQDSRIKVFFDHHQGLSVARNIGIDNSTGEFICFMDSDDIMELNALEDCYNKCIKDNLDMVFFDADSFFEDSSLNPIYEYNLARHLKEGIYDGTHFFEYQVDHNMIIVGASYLVKKSIIDSNHLKYRPGIYHEDNLHTPLVYLSCERIGLLPFPFIRRRVRHNSLMTMGLSWKNIHGYLVGFSEMMKYSKTCSPEKRRVVRKYVSVSATAVCYKARFLPFGQRIKFMFIIIFNYLSMVPILEIAKVLFPKK